MARVILGIHGLGNKPDQDTLSKWWQLSLNEGLERHGFNTELPAFKMVYWADILYPVPLDKSVEEPEDPYFIDEKYTRAKPGFERKSYMIRKKIVRFFS